MTTYQRHQHPLPLDASSAVSTDVVSWQPQYSKTPDVATTFSSPMGAPLPLVDVLFDLDVAGFTDTAIKRLYESVDRAFRENKFSSVDKLLTEITLSADLSAEFLIAVLTATLPAKTRLKSRSEVIKLTRLKVEQRQLQPDLILRGLV